MIKFCYLVEANIPFVQDSSSIFIQSSSKKFEILKGKFQDISSFYSAESFISYEVQGRTYAKTSIFTPSLYNKNELISIVLLPEQPTQTIGSIKVFFSMLPKKIFEAVAAGFDELSQEKAQALDEVKVLREKINQRENEDKGKSPAGQCEHGRVCGLDRKINEIELELEDNKKDNQVLLSENLELHNEVLELYQKKTQNEANIESFYQEAQKNLLDLTKKHFDSTTRIRTLEYSSQDLQLQNESLQQKIEFLTEELKFYKSAGSTAESQDSLLDFDKIREILNKPFLNVTSDHKPAAVKILNTKAKDEQKMKTSANERFLDCLRKYGLESEFERLGDGLYAYGNKRVTLASKGEMVLVRVGGGFMGVEEFFKGVSSRSLNLEDKAASGPATPTSLMKKKNGLSGWQTELNTLKENLNTPSPRVLRSNLKFLTTGKKSSQVLPNLSKVGKLLYK